MPELGRQRAHPIGRGQRRPLDLEPAPGLAQLADLLAGLRQVVAQREHLVSRHAHPPIARGVTGGDDQPSARRAPRLSVRANRDGAKLRASAGPAALRPHQSAAQLHSRARRSRCARPQARRAGARVAVGLVVAGEHRLAGQRLAHRLRRARRLARRSLGGSDDVHARSRKRCLTRRSSSEWKLMTTQRPPGASRSRERGEEAARAASSSWLTAMRSA